MKGRSSRKVEAWPYWAMSPLRCTASEKARAMARDAVAHASGHGIAETTGDAEMDALLAGLPLRTEPMKGAGQEENEGLSAGEGSVDREVNVAGKGETE